jgi:hypothetical protein
MPAPGSVVESARPTRCATASASARFAGTAGLEESAMNTPRVRPSAWRAVRWLAPFVCVASLALGASAGRGPDDHNLEDFIAPPGTHRNYPPSMLHADLVTGYDRRAPLDSVVYALENGSRCCRVPSLDSVWVVDYTWVYAHRGMPKRWYDAEDLLRVGDSLGLGDTANVVLTFGTYRIGVHAGSFEQARAEAKRLRPRTMPPALVGRLRLKLERAEKALGHTEPAGPDSAR